MTDGEFKSILLPYYQRMYATAYAILRDSGDASDAVQDTIAMLWQKHKNMPVPESAESFCFAAVRNMCVDRLRKSLKRYFETADAIINMSYGESADETVSYDSTKAYIRRVLEGFPDKQRKVLTLSFISRLSNNEICEITGESYSNVRQIISRGRIKLKNLLNVGF